MEITLDQVTFAAALKPIVHRQLSTARPEDFAEPELHQLFQSLLGAVAYLVHTRVDVVVFICALQRVASKPQIQHVNRLNRLLRWIQRNPRKLAFKKFQTGPTHLRAVSDAAFKKETEDGYSLRGALYVRSGPQGGSGTAEAFVSTKEPVHLVEYACKSQRHVTRSTFAAELLGAGDTIDQGLLISQLIHELEVGPLTAA